MQPDTKKYVLTNTQLTIMQLFTAKITKRFSLREVARQLGMHHALVYRASQQLIRKQLIILDKNEYSLNYKENHQELAYVEHLRTKEFLNKHKTIDLLKQDLVYKLPFGYFVLGVFGSTVEKTKPQDTDIFLIVEQTQDIEKAEKHLQTLANNYALKTDFVVLSFESVGELLITRDEKNVMNEILNKHIILYGAELFYKLIKEGRR